MHTPFHKYQIGGVRGDLPPSTPLLHTMTDQAGRTIVFVPVILSDIPIAGKPYSYENRHTGIKERITPSIIGQTQIRQSVITHPRYPGVTLSGFASLNLNGITAEEATTRWSNAQNAGADGSYLHLDPTTKRFSVRQADSTDDISTTHAFTPSDPQSAKVNDEMSPPFEADPPPSNVPVAHQVLDI